MKAHPGTLGPKQPAASEGQVTDAVVASLYAKREKVYPREVHGLFAGLRVLAVVVLLGFFYGACWLEWDGRQAFLFDLPARKFHVLGLTFFPQDFLYLTLLLIVCALALFFFTALAGRLWCGYACPQTVWTEVFLWIERHVEGDRRQRLKRDTSPWTTHKLLLKSAKHGIWIAFSLYTGFTFVGYFTPIADLTTRLSQLSLGPWESFWILFYGLATYANAGWMREQVCLYMCPYARFQSAMFDRDTLIISYDPQRGEPRGPRRRGVDHKARGLGDCIGCTLCVQVCPTGIDIRDGLQYECIGCAACIDACDDVMDKMGYAPGLIRYTTQNAVEGKPGRVLRPRMLLYAALVLCLSLGTAWSIAQRVPLRLDVIRDRNTLFRETNEGLVENVYTLRFINMDGVDHAYVLSATGIEGLELEMDHDEIRVPAGEVVSMPVRVRVDPDALRQRSSAIFFEAEAVDDMHLRVTEEARFLGGLPQ